jgi:hypothetical protein
MNLQIIQDQKHLAPGIPHHPNQKFNHQTRVHRLSVHHEPHLPLVGDGRNQTQILSPNTIALGGHVLGPTSRRYSGKL